MSKKIVIEDLDDKVYSKLMSRAVLKNEDISSFIKRILEEELESDQRKSSELIKRLKGTWTEDEFLEFKKNTAHFNKIDKEMWKNS